MELFIRIQDGQPIDHPIIGDNFRLAFPDIDVDNLPPEFVKFERIPKPNVGVFEVLEGLIYGWDNGIVKDIWQIRQMSDAEREVKTQELTTSALGMVEFLKERTQIAIQQAASTAEQEHWQNYLFELNAWQLVDPADPKIPRAMPFGTSAPGSAPNVIG